jgi:hypothetical protein
MEALLFLVLAAAGAGFLYWDLKRTGFERLGK